MFTCFRMKDANKASVDVENGVWRVHPSTSKFASGDIVYVTRPGVRSSDLIT